MEEDNILDERPKEKHVNFFERYRITPFLVICPLLAFGFLISLICTIFKGGIAMILAPIYLLIIIAALLILYIERKVMARFRINQVGLWCSEISFALFVFWMVFFVM